MFQARKSQRAREKQDHQHRQKATDIISSLAWDGMKQRWKSETDVSEGGRQSKLFCIRGTTKQMCTRKDTAQVLRLMNKLLGWRQLFGQQKVVPLAP
jgi:hypothetical protein